MTVDTDDTERMCEREKQIRERHKACPRDGWGEGEYCTGCFLLSVISILRERALASAVSEAAVIQKCARLLGDDALEYSAKRLIELAGSPSASPSAVTSGRPVRCANCDHSSLDHSSQGRCEKHWVVGTYPAELGRKRDRCTCPKFVASPSVAGQPDALAALKAEAQLEEALWFQSAFNMDSDRDEVNQHIAELRFRAESLAPNYKEMAHSDPVAFASLKTKVEARQGAWRDLTGVKVIRQEHLPAATIIASSDIYESLKAATRDKP